MDADPSLLTSWTLDPLQLAVIALGAFAYWRRARRLAARGAPVPARRRALCFVASLTGPLLRPVLALQPIARLRVLAHPLVALPIWAVNLYLWHLPVLYEGALENDGLHALQHVCF